MQTVQAHEARKQLSELIEKAYYKDTHTRIKRNKKPMAWIVGDPFMKKMGDFIGHIIEKETALADTLAILLSDDIRETIEEGMKEAERGETVPLESIFED
jgi:PHD/YefM family antitoxin component YafN of YafNO toxin-antitoxin module